MRIAICSSGRFHVCDLARELAVLGHEVRFYSYVPKSRTRKFGLPDKCARPVLAWVAPLLALDRLLAKVKADFLTRSLLIWWMDKVVSWHLEPCDGIIAMSGLFYHSTSKARVKWGAKIFIERGSRHILSQKQILDEIKHLNPKAKTVPASDVKRELRDYANADCVVLPSMHTERSFIEKGFNKAKLFRNPYGVDLKMFETRRSSQDRNGLIMVGTWCYQKGCDILEEVVREIRIPLVHVGKIGDLPFPDEKGFRSNGFVDQIKLKFLYQKAAVLVLPSRQDGFGLVLVQALACGLYVVCSDRTGGEDLKGLLDVRGKIFVVPHDNKEILKKTIIKTLNLEKKNRGGKINLSVLSWQSYGQRYDEKLSLLIKDE